MSNSEGKIESQFIAVEAYDDSGHCVFHQEPVIVAATNKHSAMLLLNVLNIKYVDVKPYTSTGKDELFEKENRRYDSKG